MARPWTCLLLLLTCLSQQTVAQQVVAPVNLEDVRRYMQVLAGDSLEGRGNFQPGLLKAAKYVGAAFSRAGLQPYPGHPGYFIPFRPAGGRKNEPADSLDWNGKVKNPAEYYYFHRQPGDYTDRSLKDFLIRQVEVFDDSTFLRLDDDSSAVILWCTSGPGGNFPGKQTTAKNKRLADYPFLYPVHGLNRDVLLVISDTAPSSLLLKGSDSYYESLEYNVVGVLPGKGNESIMLSSHYDHEGIVTGDFADRIMNGANDNASGTTAVMTLAGSFAAEAQPGRSIVFACFAAEELGLVGSNHFISNEDLTGIVAVVNLEMIGLAQFGKGTVFITGENDSSLPDLLRSGLKSAGLKVIRDPVPEKLLYERSDNYPFALKDIPAHSIMGSTDDDECYHQFCDDLSRIDMDNLCSVINRIGIALQPFIDGTIPAKKMR